tara:strand:- start:290 stop:760 length:471 start_codon:yes stop_codon:yes gene_type:complete
MNAFIINYIDITPNTSYSYNGRGLMIEMEVDNFFNKSFKFADIIKSQSTEFHNNFYHLYIPIMEDQIYVRPLETLPHYEDQDKKYVEIITHLRNNLSSNDFKKFIQDYKRFLVDINCKKDILSKIELIIRHDEMPHYSVREIVSSSVSNRNKSISR